MKRLIPLGSSILAMAALLVLAPDITHAHEQRAVLDDQYTLTVGFLDVPAVAGELNGLSLRIEMGDGETAEPVLGLAETLEAEVLFGDQSMPLKLSSVFNDDGNYRSIFILRAEGDYTFHITGEIDGEAIDETFTSSPEGFDSVQPREPMEFPKTL